MKACPQCHKEYPGGEFFCPTDGARLSRTTEMPIAPTDALLGQLVADRYRVRRRIGEGGMGIVYEAEHVVIEKRVAMKVLREDFSSRPEVVARFRQEAKSASRIGHENIVDVSDFGTVPGGRAFFVMEYLEGEDLAERLKRKKTMTPDEALPILEQICRALGAAHGKGIVHRDMKPENVFLAKRDEREDFVKILDFGIAKMTDVELQGAGDGERKLTKTGMVFGTPEYMSPEQAAGKPLDHRVDIYSTGIIMYEMFAGRVPFTGDTFMGVLTQHMFEEPPPIRKLNPNARVPPALEAVIRKAMSKDAVDRQGSALELLAEVERAFEGVAPTLKGGKAGRRDSTGRHRFGTPASGRARAVTMDAQTFERRRAVVAVPIVLLLVGGAGAGGWWYWNANRRGDAARTHVGSAPPTPSPPPVPVAAPPANPPVPARVPEVAPASALARFTVRSNVPGAIVEVAGRGRVGVVPCEVEAPEGQTLTLHLSRGGRSVERVVVAHAGAIQEVVFPAQVERVAGHAPDRHGPGPSHPPQKRGSDSDLKVPSALFQEPP